MLSSVEKENVDWCKGDLEFQDACGDKFLFGVGWLLQRCHLSKEFKGLRSWPCEHLWKKKISADINSQGKLSKAGLCQVYSRKHL